MNLPVCSAPGVLERFRLNFFVLSPSLRLEEEARLRPDTRSAADLSSAGRRESKRKVFQGGITCRKKALSAMSSEFPPNGGEESTMMLRGIGGVSAPEVLLEGDIGEGTAQAGCCSNFSTASGGEDMARLRRREREGKGKGWKGRLCPKVDDTFSGLQHIYDQSRHIIILQTNLIILNYYICGRPSTSFQRPSSR